jgi:hypothetical protein
VGERHREISEEESIVNVVIKHSITYQLGKRAGGAGGGEGGVILTPPPFSPAGLC